MSQLALDLATIVDRRRVLGGLAAGLGGAALAASGQGAIAQATACVATPRETKGPFPADGSNGRPRPINVLATEGIVRRDIRPSFAGLRGAADGVPLELELQLARASGCGAATQGAVYLWQNDAAGYYSLYSRTDVNYLRGLQTADSQGRVRFTAIVPGCYGGRYPHCHFEVYASVAEAVRGTAPLLVGQFAFPEAECRAIYQTDRRYGESLANLGRQPITRDFVFADASSRELEQETIKLTGDVRQGYRGTGMIAV